MCNGRNCLLILIVAFSFLSGCSHRNYAPPLTPEIPLKVEPGSIKEAVTQDKPLIVKRDELMSHLEAPGGIGVERETCPDSDGDGLNDCQESRLGTDPHIKDTDSDGLADYEEVVKYRTNPMKADSDGDGISDGEEIRNGTNPLGTGDVTVAQKAIWDHFPSLNGGPEIMNIQVVINSGAKTMSVSWSTDRDADGIVNYGETTGYGTFKSDFPFVRSHTITVPILLNKTYHYAIRACTPRPDSRCTSSTDLVADAR